MNQEHPAKALARRAIAGLPELPARRPEFRRLLHRPRRLPTTTSLLGPRLEVPDGPSFAAAYRSIFLEHLYRFETDSPAPRIIDGGANVGLSAIYFKRLFPSARVLAFEADPALADLCRRNLAACGFADVEVRQQALADRDGTVRFSGDGADAGRIAHGPASIPSTPSAAPAESLEVPCVRLAPLLDAEPLDLLKLDIEGAETDVLRDAAGSLPNVRRLFVEYHSFAGREQTLPELLAILQNAGFRLHLVPENHSPSPLAERLIYDGIDLQLNVFAYREGDGRERPT